MSLQLFCPRCSVGYLYATLGEYDSIPKWLCTGDFDSESSLQQRLDDSRIVARAKLLLISHLGMSEGDAHRYIEKTAMDSCLPRRDVAEGIIRTYEE